MAVRVGPTEEYPTHHVSFSDGRKTIGLILADSRGNAQGLSMQRNPTVRTALKTSTGNQGYDDYERPWAPVAQSNWQGGRGNRRFETDTTRYYDGHAINSMYTELFLGPQEQITRGTRGQLYDLPGNVRWLKMLSGASKYIARRLDFDSSFTAALLTVLVKRSGEPADLTVVLCQNNAGNPGTAVETWTIDTTDIADVESEYYDLTLTTPLVITNGDIYWLKIYAATSDEENCWQIGYAKKDANTKVSSNGTTWISTDVISPYFRVRDAEANLKRKFFEYKGGYYLVENQISGAAKVFINGDRGAADANTGALSTLIDGTKTWATDEFAGAWAWIVGGTGSREPVPYRKILSNTDTTLTLESAWTITHDTTTEYVIVGAEVWKELSTTGLSGEVTDVLVTGYCVYFCQGDSINIRKMQWTAAAGHEYADDSTNKASYLTGVRYSDGMKVWAGLNSPIPQVKLAPVQTTWASAMSFGTALELHDEYGRINSMIEYGSYRTLYIIREGTINYVGRDDTSDYLYEIPISEIHQAKYLHNGAGVVTHDVYLAFSMGKGGVERWYDGSLDDVGPNRDEGLPSERQGYISAMLAYPGRYFAAMNAGAGRSSVLGTMGGGNWHELFRAWVDGMEVSGLGFQTVPGDALDRLWVSVGKDVLWLPFPTGSVNPQSDGAYLYRHEGSITSAWIYSGMFDLIKTYHSMKLHTEHLSEDVCIWMDYRVDEETEWTSLPEPFVESPAYELELNDLFGVGGKKLQYRLRFETNDAAISPILSTAVLETIAIVPVKYAYPIPMRLEDQEATLQNERDADTAAQKLRQLDAWAENASPLLMHTNIEAFDNVVVFLDPLSLRPYKEQEPGYIGSLVANELRRR